MKTPSIKQIMAIKYFSEGLSKRQALLRAGYSVSTADQPSRVFKTKSMRSLVGNVQDELVDEGITSNYVSSKIKEWFEAEKTVNGLVVSDYNIQIKAFDLWFKIIRNNTGF